MILPTSMLCVNEEICQALWLSVLLSFVMIPVCPKVGSPAKRVEKVPPGSYVPLGPFDNWSSGFKLTSGSVAGHASPAKMYSAT